MTGDREARARKVARLWASGLSMREVARRVGVHHQTVMADLAQLDGGVSYRTYRERAGQRRVPVRDKRMTEAARLRAGGMSLRQIAKQLAVSHQTVSNDLGRWDARQAAMPANVIPLARKASKSGAENSPRGGKNTHQKLTGGES